MTTYIVSLDPSLIALPDHFLERGQIPQYATEADAIESIKRDEHGKIGTKYVLAVTTEVVAVASRPWELVRQEDSES